jgi:hypothetical protein
MKKEKLFLSQPPINWGFYLQEAWLMNDIGVDRFIFFQ